MGVNTNGSKFINLLVTVAGGVAVLAFGGSIASLRAQTALEKDVEHGNKFAAIEHQVIRDALEEHEEIGAHAGADKRLDKLELRAMETRIMVGEIYKKVTRKDPVELAEMPDAE